MDEHLIWCDCEMTGLNPDVDEIVEIAFLATDLDLQPIDDGINMLIRPSKAAIDQMSPQVRKLHEHSGLLPALEGAKLDVSAASELSLTYIRSHARIHTAPLCGNSIGIDRRFLAKYMPAIEQYLHYRSIDVSSIKELCRRWYPGVYAKLPRKSEAHRALDDIHDSIAELAFYRANVFLPVS